jgi:membrane protease YdiL (CAAX protease family)
MRALKSIGAFILFFVVAIAVQSGIQFAIIRRGLYTPSPGRTPGDFALSDGVGLLAALFTLLLASRIERRRVTDYYLPTTRSAIPQSLEGFVWGTVTPVLAAVLVIAFGGATYHGLALHGDALVRSALVWFGTMVLLGLFEEIAFRSYGLDVLARGFGFWIAAAINSILFGALHYFTKPMENATDAVTVALLTLFMCLTIRRTNALWFAIGFHAAFDYFALIVLATPNTGNAGQPVAGHLLDIRYTGPAWLTGGPRGLEASAPMFAVIGLLFAGYLWRTRAARPTAAQGGRGLYVPERW